MCMYNKSAEHDTLMDAMIVVERRCALGVKNAV